MAVAIEANALALVNREGLLRTLHLGRQRGVPLLVFSDNPETGQTLLRHWSDGAAVGAERSGIAWLALIQVGYSADIAGYWRIWMFLFPVAIPSTLHWQRVAAQEIVALRNDRQVAPIFIKTDVRGQEVFLLCKMHPVGDGADCNADSTASQFMEIAPLMMFVKYGAGERGWHTDQH